MVIDATDIGVAFDLAPEKAVQYLQKKGYAITTSWRDLDAQAHQTAFTVAGIAQADLLMDIKGMLEQSAEQGLPMGDFKKQLRTKLQNRGWLARTENVLTPSRIANIYRTNMQSAYMAGRRAEQLEAIATRPYWQFIAVGDSRTSSICRGLDGQVYRAVDPIWGSAYPPNHHFCRSRVRTLSEKQLKREGLEVLDGSKSTWKPAEGFDGPWSPDLSKYPNGLRQQVQQNLNNAPAGTSRSGSDIRTEIAKVVARVKDEAAELQRQSMQAFNERRHKDQKRLWKEYLAKRDSERDEIHALFLRSTEAKLSLTVDTDFAQVHQDNISKAAQFVQRFLGDGYDLKDLNVDKRGARASYVPSTKTVNVSGTDLGTLVHEIGHHVELTVPDVLAKVQKWMDDRTKGDSVEKLRDITNLAYHANEVTTKDAFIDSYIGKVYGTRSARTCTEVISMGLEMLYKQPQRLAEQDPDMFDFLIDLFP